MARSRRQLPVTAGHHQGPEAHSRLHGPTPHHHLTAARVADAVETICVSVMTPSSPVRTREGCADLRSLTGHSPNRAHRRAHSAMRPQMLGRIAVDRRRHGQQRQESPESASHGIPTGRVALLDHFSSQLGQLQCEDGDRFLQGGQPLCISAHSPATMSISTGLTVGSGCRSRYLCGVFSTMGCQASRSSAPIIAIRPMRCATSFPVRTVREIV